MKVKDEVELMDRVRAIVVPAAERSMIEPAVPEALKSRVFYVENDCPDIWAWAEKVYGIAETAPDIR